MEKVIATSFHIGVTKESLKKALKSLDGVTAIREKFAKEISEVIGGETITCPCSGCVLDRLTEPDAADKIPKSYTLMADAYNKCMEVVIDAFSENESLAMLLPLIIMPPIAPTHVDDIPGGLDMLYKLYVAMHVEEHMEFNSDILEEDLGGLADWNKISELYYELTFMVCRGFDNGEALKRGDLQIAPQDTMPALTPSTSLH